MSERSLADITRKRLEAYGLFDAKVVDSVARLADIQGAFESYQALFKKVGVPLKPTLFITGKGRGVPLVDIDSREGVERGVLVVHLPMGNSLDPNQLYQVATLALAFPSHRIIAFGNPSGKPFAYTQENLSVRDWWRVAFTKKLRGAVSAELEYLSSQGIKNAYHVGYSYGALKALLTVYYGEPSRAKGLILLDPVAHPRYPQQLLKDFSSTFKPLGEYVNRTKLQTFLDARQDAVKFVRYSQGIVRPVNIAIGFMLARTDFISLLQQALEKYAHITAFVAWGAKSELGNDAHMKASLHTLAHDTAKGRVHALRLDNDSHAFANDLFLYVAILQKSLADK